MRSSIRALVVVAIALLPGLAAASEFHVSIQEATLVFGPVGATLEPAGFDAIFIDGEFQETPWFSWFDGDVTFETGPLLSLSIDDSNLDRVSSSYLFGPGTFTLTAHWTDQFGNVAEGRYVAPLLELLIDIRCEQELSAGDCGDAAGNGNGSLGDAFVSVGPGLFERSLAGILGLARPGGAFSFDLALDGITGAPSDRRIAGSASGAEDVDIPVEIPEPSILSLLLLSPILGLRFRR